MKPSTELYTVSELTRLLGKPSSKALRGLHETVGDIERLMHEIPAPGFEADDESEWVGLQWDCYSIVPEIHAFKHAALRVLSTLGTLGPLHSNEAQRIVRMMVTADEFYELTNCRAILELNEKGAATGWRVFACIKHLPEFSRLS